MGQCCNGDDNTVAASDAASLASHCPGGKSWHYLESWSLFHRVFRTILEIHPNARLCYTSWSRSSFESVKNLAHSISIWILGALEGRPVLLASGTLAPVRTHHQSQRLPRNIGWRVDILGRSVVGLARPCAESVAMAKCHLRSLSRRATHWRAIRATSTCGPSTRE